jgi:GGDEF domain-containing protein
MSDETGEGPLEPDNTGPLPSTPEGVIRVLLEVTTALTSTLDLDDVLGEVLTRTVRLGDAAAGTLILLDGVGRAMRKIAVRCGQPHEVAEEVVSRVLSCGLAHWVNERRGVARVADCWSDPRWLRITGDWYEPRSAICVPVMRHGRVMATLTLTHTATDHFGEQIVDLLVAIAGQAAIAIENARLFGEVQRLATTDDLTGLCNRRRFLELAERACGQREAQDPLAVVMLDVDHFKLVNDGYGHTVGDEVLTTLAARLRGCVEAPPPSQAGTPEDVPPRGREPRGAGTASTDDRSIVGRYGGEEFVVLLPASEREVALRRAEELRRRVSGEAFVTSAGPLAVTISLGVAVAPEDGVSLRQLLKSADDRMYEAKAAGRDRVR